MWGNSFSRYLVVESVLMKVPFRGLSAWAWAKLVDPNICFGHITPWPLGHN